MYTTPDDINFLAASGQFPGRSVVHKFGRNPSVGTGGYEDIWFSGGDYNFLEAAVALRIKSGGNAADTAAGAGAREITVEGLDENWATASETIATAGASASSATTTTFIRVNRAYVSGAGAYGAGATADVEIETTGGTTVALIEAAANQTQAAIYTVPAGYTAYLTRFDISVGSNADTSEVRLYRRLSADVVAAPFTSPRIVTAISARSFADIKYNSYPAFPGKTDVWCRGINLVTGNTPINCTFDMILVG